VADKTDNEAITEIVPKRLGQYLLDTVSSLREFHPEFPPANMSLRLPSITAFAPDPDFRPLTPYLKNPAANIKNSKAKLQYVVGIYDFTIQLDLWTGNKEERDDLFDELFNALNPNITPMGLGLVMEEYFDQICDYLYVGHKHGDSEERSQRDEWRITLNLLATCNAIRTKKEFIIEDTQTASEIEDAGEISTTFEA